MVNLGFFNRIIVDDVMMYDQQGDSMLFASRISAKVDYLPLTQGKISIASAQLFGLKANLYKQTANSKANFQFVLDSLASKDTTKHTPLDLHIGSLIIRHGAVSYHQRDIASPSGIFSPKHIDVRDISSHIILNHATDDAVHLLLKKLSLKDHSGLQISSLHFKLTADKKQARLEDFQLCLPHSVLSLGKIQASYQQKDGKIDLNTLQFSGSIEQSKVTLADIASLVPTFRKFDDAVFLSSRFSGTNTSIRLHQFSLRAGSGHVNLQAKGWLNQLNATPRWKASIDNLNLTGEGIKLIAQNLGHRINIPKEVLRLGTIHYRGALGGQGGNFSSKGELDTEVGNARLLIELKNKHILADVSTQGIALGKVLDNPKFGILAADLHAAGTKDNLQAQGDIARFDFNKYSFRNINIDGAYQKGTVKGLASINDPNIRLKANGRYSIPNKKYDFTAFIGHLRPNILGVKMADRTYSIDDVTLSASNDGRDSHIDVEAPFANLHAKGQCDPTTIYQSLINKLADKLPTIPGIKKIDAGKLSNDFSLQANITSTEILRRMFGIPFDINSPIHIVGNVSDHTEDINLRVSVPQFSYKGAAYHGGEIDVMTDVNNILRLNATITQGEAYVQGPHYQIEASAANNILTTWLNYSNHSSKLPIKGHVEAETQFFKTAQGVSAAHVKIHPSHILLGDAQWNVQPSDVIYEKNNLLIDHFAIKHNDQHIIVSGRATPNKEDSIVADLKDVDVAYILNLVNFHSVEFSGKASGKAIVKSIFQSPEAYANLDIKDFTFEQGPLGVLHANVNYNKPEGQIDIKATADDGPEHQTYIDGYVSPKKNYIDLGIEAAGTSLKFMESFCGSFMDNVQAWSKGKLRVVGPLSNINLIGDITAWGKMHMTQLNTDYTFNHLRAHAIPDDIQLVGDTIYDRDRHIALVNGGIHHQHLTRLSFDLDVKAKNFLGFDTHEFGDNTFYGTVYATGRVGIHGKSGETLIDINATPEPGSVFVYNVTSPDAVSDKTFIHWRNILPLADDNGLENSHNAVPQAPNAQEDIDIPSDMRINFLINTNPNLTLKLLMDEQTGDYISLTGNGVIKANYFNKGGFDMFGNYVVDHGIYKLTIQNIIKKDFVFNPGGTITFGGNPYNAPIKLQAKYTVNGVPLSDLSIGRSFSGNNIKVDCLMNISGTPGAPKVDFDMDLPTVNSDAKQMIYSIINSQEEMNQQVLYLLGIGRFYAQTKNNQATENAAQQSQTSLAMQSILSGTISQQINSVLSNLTKTNNWNFGANISTGDEGFNNAEYEGLLSGRLLNNRLLFNGQFGYRDNANATQSFIGDFDLRYLIFPNGNLSIHMYNQANDRYFTRNSLNTQGIGLIMKKDFNSIGDLFGIKKKKKKKNSR